MDARPRTPQARLRAAPDATQRLVRTVDGLDDEALGGPSGLPDWTRAHVVAHLALNAEGLARVLRRPDRGQADDHVPPPTRPATATSTTWPPPSRPSCATGSWPGRPAHRRGRRGSPTSSGPRRSSARPAAARSGTPPSPACGCARWRSTTSTSTPASRRRGWSDAFAAHLIDAMVKRDPSERVVPGARHRPGQHLGDRRRPRRVRHDRRRARRRPGLVADGRGRRPSH